MRLRNVSPRGDLRVADHGHVRFGEEFDVLKEHVAGLIHQAYGEDKNFEPADGEAQAAVDAAQTPSAEPEPTAEPVAEPAAPEVQEPTVEPAEPVTTEEN